jgi:hypothetical protein
MLVDSVVWVCVGVVPMGEVCSVNQLFNLFFTFRFQGQRNPDVFHPKFKNGRGWSILVPQKEKYCVFLSGYI